MIPNILIFLNVAGAAVCFARGGAEAYYGIANVVVALLIIYFESKKPE